jgi:hypothetical protein
MELEGFRGSKKQKQTELTAGYKFIGADGQNRTADTGIFSRIIS